MHAAGTGLQKRRGSRRASRSRPPNRAAAPRQARRNVPCLAATVDLDQLMTRLNPLVAWVLRSPLHPMLDRVLLMLRVTGRRTGRQYRIPVGYQRDGDTITVLVSKAPRKQWWRNYRVPWPAGTCSCTVARSTGARTRSSRVDRVPAGYRAHVPPCARTRATVRHPLRSPHGPHACTVPDRAANAVVVSIDLDGMGD